MTKGEYSDLLKRKKPKQAPSESSHQPSVDMEGLIDEAKTDGQQQKPKEKLKRIGAQIPESVYKKLKKKALEDDTNITDLVRKWISEYLEESD